MDAPAAEVAGKIPRLRPAPLQQDGSGVVEGVEGGDILPVPAHVPDGTLPADHLRSPVEDHGGILVLGLLGRTEALIQSPQGVRTHPQTPPQAVRLPRGPPLGDPGLPQQ